MICLSSIMNLRNSNLSTNRTNNNYRQNNVNAFKADSVSFGNVIINPQYIADVLRTLAKQVCTDPKTVDNSSLGWFARATANYARQSIKAAEGNFKIRFPLPSKTILPNSATVVSRKFEPDAGDMYPKLCYRMTFALKDVNYPRQTYLFITAIVDDANIAQSKAYNPEAPHTFFAKIGLENNKTWRVANAEVVIPPELNRADFHLYRPKRTETIILR